jgi:Na+-translocating ferredoxin:NAD+ oxidoreductase subunit B
MMLPDVYDRLADRLADTPNGFPRSKKGTDCKLLAKMFTPGEAALGAVMRLERESAEVIAARAGIDAASARTTLKNMVRKGLITAGRGQGSLAFALMPFAVGSWEEALPYLDEEMAQLFDQLMEETHGEGMVDVGPAMQRVIPVEQSVRADIGLLPYEQASELVGNAKSWGVRQCLCRKQKALVGERCEYPDMNCVTFAPVEGAFANQPHTRPVSREEALQILVDAEAAGLVHSVYNQQEGIYYVCNCCPCCCAIMRGVVKYGQAHALAHSDFLAVVDENACTGCEACLERCHFSALTVPDGLCTVDVQRCMGCGLCVSECHSGALSLVRRPAEQRTDTPANHRQWSEERAVSRGVPLEELT